MGRGLEQRVGVRLVWGGETVDRVDQRRGRQALQGFGRIRLEKTPVVQGRRVHFPVGWPPRLAVQRQVVHVQGQVDSPPRVGPRQFFVLLAGLVKERSEERRVGTERDTR